MRVSAEVQVKPGEATDFSLRHRDREKVTSELDGAKKRRGERMFQGEMTASQRRLNAITHGRRNSLKHPSSGHLLQLTSGKLLVKMAAWPVINSEAFIYSFSSSFPIYLVTGY